MPAAAPPSSDTAGNILNRVAAEVGLTPVIDPYSSSDDAFVQLTYLLNTAGEELATMFAWEQLQREHQIITSDQDSGDYDLPDDFNYIMNQTGWERAENVPLFGPLSPQDWQYLLGRDLVNYTIYASFRLKQGKFSIFPQPPPNALDIHFEYVTVNWVLDGDDPLVGLPGAVKSNDVPLYDRTLLARYIKVKYYESKGLDSVKAQDDFNQLFMWRTGLNTGAEILNAGSSSRGFPYLNYYNTPDTGYGRVF